MSFGSTVKGFFGARSGAEDPIKKFSSLNVRTNSLVSIDLTPFYVHDEYMVMENPGTEQQVTHVGQLKIMGMEVFRFYTSSLTGEGESIIQVFDSADSKDVILFRQIDEIHPQTMEDWNEWTGTQNEGLLQNELLAIQDGEVVYEKVWGSDLVSCTEHVIADADKEEPYDYPIRSMMYRRDISEDGEEEFLEYLLVSIEDEERINMYVGFDVNPAGLTIS